MFVPVCLSVCLSVHHCSKEASTTPRTAGDPHLTARTHAHIRVLSELEKSKNLIFRASSSALQKQKASPDARASAAVFFFFFLLICALVGLDIKLASSHLFLHFFFSPSLDSKPPPHARKKRKKDSRIFFPDILGGVIEYESGFFCALDSAIFVGTP